MVEEMSVALTLRNVQVYPARIALLALISLGLFVMSIVVGGHKAYAVDYGCGAATPGVFQFPVLEADPSLKDFIAVGITPGTDDFRDFPLPAGDTILPGDYRIYALFGDDHFMFRRVPGAAGPFPAYDYNPWFELGPIPPGYLNGGWPGHFGNTTIGWHNQRTEQIYVQLDTSDPSTTTPYTNPDFGITGIYDNTIDEPYDFNDLYDYIGGLRDIDGNVIDPTSYPGLYKTGTYGPHGAPFVMYEDIDLDWPTAPTPAFPALVDQDRGFDLGQVTLSGPSNSIRIRHIRDVFPALSGPSTQSIQPIRVNIECVSATTPDPVDRGYIEVNNGSVWAGGNYDPSPTGYGSGWCDVSSGSSLDGYIRSSNDGSLGSYASYIAGATGDITQFGSITTTLQRLMMANAGTAGNFNTQGQCITDLYTYLSDDPSFSPQIIPAVGFPTGSGRQGQYVVSGDLSINTPQQLSAGEKITLIVDGDVTINGNITYDPSYNVSNPSDIPSLVIVARGDINIGSNVTELDGLYMARPVDPTTASFDGVIDTCHNAPSTGRLYNDPATSIPEECDQQLIVRGMFIANDIEFRRTHGGIDGTYEPQEPAEYFDFNSELYLAQPLLISTFEPDLEIQSVRDLPPVIN